MSDKDNTQPVVLGANKSGSEERIHIFTIDDVEYTMPAKVRPTVGLKYMRDLQRGVDAQVANANLLEAVLGTETYEALVDYDDLTEEEFNSIMEIVQLKALGGSENAAKN